MREIAGLRCDEVLELLPGSIDGELDTATAARVRAHVAACDQCERFGGRYAALVRTLRTRHAPASAPDQALRARLRARLAAERPRPDA